ncbi:MAG: GNAT family N-acetyltransferase [Maricaulaceae bacterium]
MITTERLILRPRTLADIDACIAMDCDPEVTKFIEGPWNGGVEHRAFLTERMTTAFESPLGYWAITRREAEDEFLGWVMMLPEGDDIEIGWRLTRQTWGQGIATEAVRGALMRLTEHRLKVDIIAAIHPENTGSIRVAEKVGMGFEKEELIDGVLEKFYRLRIV